MSFVGLRIQHYQVFKYLGNGGMGDVYAAYDVRLDRKVALKAIRREHRLKPEVKARLLREARVLSGLEHPHICRIYDLIDNRDSDILVLELIEGESLKSVFPPEAATSADRMRIAGQVASALAAAHEQGVVHRDLKPDNVMLTPTGDVKVLDFGLARRLNGEGCIAPGTARPDATRPSLVPDPDSTETPLQTRQGSFVGTPAYMSPEQILGETVTTASDMYSLGVLLQELFTGKSAYEPCNLPATLVKVSRADTLPIEDVDPDLAALIERLQSPAPARRPSAVDVCERLRWIGAKPRRRRRRLLRAAVMAFLVLASVALTFQTLRIGRVAERANREAERANREAASSQQVSEFLIGLFELSDPDGGQAQQHRAADASAMTAREILAGGAGRISSELAGQPLIRARLMDTIGEIQRKLGLFDEALPLATEALETRLRILGPDHPDVAESQAHLANLYWKLGRFDDAAPLYESSIRVREQGGGSGNVELASSLNGLGIIRWNIGDYEAAERLHLRALEIREEILGPDHNRVAASLNNLGELCREQGKLDQARPLYERALAIWRNILGPKHHAVGVALVNLAAIHEQLGNPAQSRAFNDRGLAILEAALGPDHPYVGYALAGRGSNLLTEGRHAEAEAPLSRSLAILEKSLGANHVDVGRGLKQLARALAGSGEAARADALNERSRKILTKTLGADHPEVTVDLGTSSA